MAKRPWWSGNGAVERPGGSFRSPWCASCNSHQQRRRPSIFRYAHWRSCCPCTCNNVAFPSLPYSPLCGVSVIIKSMHSAPALKPTLILFLQACVLRTPWCSTAPLHPLFTSFPSSFSPSSLSSLSSHPPYPRFHLHLETFSHGKTAMGKSWPCKIKKHIR